MSNNRFRLTNPFRYYLERQFVKGAHYQLLGVAALIGLISIIGGLLVSGLQEDFETYSETVWWAFLRLTDPGYLGDDEGTWKRVVSTFLTISGYVVFLGALVAIMTQWLQSKMQQLTDGYTPIAAKHHVVILGDTTRTEPIAEELLQGGGRLKRFLKKFGKKQLKLVILVERSAAELLQKLKANQQIGHAAEDVILRSGSPLESESLMRVDCYHAAAVIIPSQTVAQKTLVSADVETIKTLLSLNSYSRMPGKGQLPYVVAEINDDRRRSAALNAYNGDLEVISSDAFICRLIAQNVRHRGLSEVYEELLTKGKNNDLYVREHGSMAGKTIAEAERYFRHCLVLGLIRPTDEGFMPMLNLPGSTPIEKGDRLVFLARMFEDTEPASQPVHEKISVEDKGVAVARTSPSGKEIKKRVLILGWNHKLPALLKEFSSYQNEEFTFTVVSILPPEHREKLIQQLFQDMPPPPCTHIEADYMNEVELVKVQPETFDHVIFSSSDLLSEGEEADARSIVGNILLHEMLQNREKKPGVLLELAEESSVGLIQQDDVDMLVSTAIISHVLAQVALRREVHAIYTELFSAGGAEIIFGLPENYGIENGTYSFQELAVRTAREGDKLMGTFRYDRDSSHKRGHVKMNPPRNASIVIDAQTKLVVLTTYG
ncbi:MAG: CASTOR/POLLUX-related putative ion channel [Balneolaceae bacterium]